MFIENLFYNLDFNISYNKYLQYQSKYPDICVQDFYLEVNIVKPYQTMYENGNKADNWLF